VGAFQAVGEPVSSLAVVEGGTKRRPRRPLVRLVGGECGSKRRTRQLLVRLGQVSGSRVRREAPHSTRILFKKDRDSIRRASSTSS
jgi:hypothetical protein